jgi:outer membrane lipoprotein-sorting protein
MPALWSRITPNWPFPSFPWEIPVRLLPAALLALAVVAPLRADDAAKALLDKAIKAQGGAEAAAKLTDIGLKAKGQVMEGNMTVEMSFDMSISAFDRVRMGLSINEGGRTHRGMMVLNGDKAHFKDADTNREENPPPEVVPTIQSVVLAVRAPGTPAALLAAKNLTLTHGGEAKVDDTAAEVLRISRKDRPDVTLYFDKKTHLPLKAETSFKEGANDVALVFTYSDFKEFGGVKHFTKVKMTASDKITMDLELTELKLGVKFEANTFEKP